MSYELKEITAEVTGANGKLLTLTLDPAAKQLRFEVASPNAGEFVSIGATELPVLQAILATVLANNFTALPATA